MTVLHFNPKHRDDTSKNGGRFDAIAPLVELSDIPIELRYPHLFSDGRQANYWWEAVAWCANKANLSTRSIWRIYSAFRKGGVGALSRKRRSDKGYSRYFARHTKAARFAAYLRIARQLGVPAIRRAIIEDCAIVEISSEAVPSIETIRAFLKTTPMPALIDLALQGQSAFRGVAADYAKRGCFGKRERGIRARV